MAKKAKKESGLPVVIALVFFVLLSVGLGVFCYVLYSDQEGKDAEVAKVQKELTTERKTAKIEQNKAKLYRIVLGIEEPDERNALTGEAKPGDEYATELRKINDRIDDRLKQVKAADGAVLTNKDVLNWNLDGEGKLSITGPSKYIFDVTAKALSERELSKVESTAKFEEYKTSVDNLKAKSDAFDAAIATLSATTTKLANDMKAKLDSLQAQADKNGKDYKKDVADFLTKVNTAQDEITRAKAEAKQLGDVVTTLKVDLAAREEQKKKGEQFFDEPLGKILRRLPDDTVEIDIGSNDKAKAGLTFSVLPADFPVKGYQSRVKTFRVADERGVFRDAPRFVEKANIEIIEVLGPTSSKARIVSESDSIRDRLMVGDLLYNVAWRRGYVDHVALFGIFDVNGDGSDDIKNIVKDFDRMGIPVDAYFDLNEKKWIGELTSKTRYVIEGYMPNTSANDPYLKEKTDLTGLLSEARVSAKNKGLNVISFRDMFPRMGYRVRLDVTDDKVNQATSPYLKSIGAPVAPAPMGN